MASINHINLVWKKKLQLEAKSAMGLKLKFDALKKYGGDESSMSPMENVLASLAACSSYDVLTILKKRREDVKGLEVEAIGHRRQDDYPKIFTKINLHYIIKGSNISSESVEKAIKLSQEKYCSVGAMLEKVVKITTSYKIIDF